MFYVPKSIKKLNLSQSAERLYYVISLYSKGEKIYFESEKTTAQSIGMSDRSVRRAKKKLVDMGLIEKVCDGEIYGYKLKDAVIVEDKAPDSSGNGEKCENILDNKPRSAPLCLQKSRNTADTPHTDNYKDILKGLPRGVDAIEYLRRYKRASEPQNRYVKLGKSKHVFMTERQLEHLYELVSVDRLEYYVTLLEQIIEKATKSLEPWPKNHYRIIKKWIQEDTAL